MLAKKNIKNGKNSGQISLICSLGLNSIRHNKLTAKPTKVNKATKSEIGRVDIYEVRGNSKEVGINWSAHGTVTIEEAEQYRQQFTKTPEKT
jgi:hypothetical protein